MVEAEGPQIAGRSAQRHRHRPIGATEQHGPHLPSMVDWRCVHEVSHRAARLMEDDACGGGGADHPLRHSEHHMSLNGMITLDYATMYAVIAAW
jgi:creatinine amidohydrolase